MTVDSGFVTGLSELGQRAPEILCFQIPSCGANEDISTLPVSSVVLSS